MPDKKKDRELTGEELKGVAGGKAAQQDTHKGQRSPYGAPPKPHQIDPDPPVAKPPFGTDRPSKKG